MSKINQSRMIRSLPSLSADQLQELQNAISRQLNTRAADVLGYIIAVTPQTLNNQIEIAFMDGFDHAIDLVEQYYEPIYRVTKDLEHIVGLIAGIVWSHPPGQIPTERLQDIIYDLGNALNYADIFNQKAIAKFGGRGSDFSYVVDIRQAALDFITGATDDQPLKPCVKN